MKAKTKRVVTALLAVVMLLTTLLPLTASAADVTMDLNNCHVSWDYTLTDEDGNTTGGEVSLDLTGKKPGRGAYVCHNPQCLVKARKARRFERVFSCKIPDDVYDKMEEEISE